MTMLPLSDHVRELIQKARIVSFATWHDTHPAKAIQVFQAADDEGRYLTDEDLQQIQQLAPATTALTPIAQQFRDRAPEIVDEARATVLNTFPHITEPGGGLFPAERADACWRDFWHFLRCITYGIAGGHLDYTSAAGLQAMEQLYQELQVPLEAMVVGLEGIKTASLKGFDPEQQAELSPYFEYLITHLRQFHSLASVTQGRMLLSHNFDVSAEEVPALSREAFTKVFRLGLMAHPDLHCRLIQHPHWIVEILFSPQTFSPQQVGECCAQALADKRQTQGLNPDNMPEILILGGVKATPPTSTDPDALQPGEWGVDVVETRSAAAFLGAIAWETTIVQKPPDSIFKVERKNA
jgi:Protein of unknown function (DUF2656)/Phycobilisome protein